MKKTNSTDCISGETEPPLPGTRGKHVDILGAFFVPALAPWVVGYRLLRSAGWKRALFTISLLVNLFFIAVVVIAGTLPDDNSVCSPEALAKLPSGFTCYPQDPLYFAQMSVENEAQTVLPPTVFVFKDGQRVAAFTFSKPRGELASADLYDGMGRSRVTFALVTGSASYHLYSDGPEPDVSFRDADGDGIPDWRVDWESNTSFARCAEVSWCASGSSQRPRED
jgi:hypothetical protein